MGEMDYVRCVSGRNESAKGKGQQRSQTNRSRWKAGGRWLVFLRRKSVDSVWLINSLYCNKDIAIFLEIFKLIEIPIKTKLFDSP